MKKLLIILSILAFLLVAGPVQASWVDEIPLGKDVVHIGMHCYGEYCVVTIKNADGICTEYKIVDDKLIELRVCGSTDWSEWGR